MHGDALAALHSSVLVLLMLIDPFTTSKLPVIELPGDIPILPVLTVLNSPLKAFPNKKSSEI
jgi:hypothetical protein